MTVTASLPGAPPREPAPEHQLRLRGVDVARGLAVLGMFGVHLMGPGDLAWGDPASWLSIVNGRSSILFATLAGVSIALVTGREHPLTGDALVHARTRLLVRAALLFALGGLLDLLGTGIAVILEVYALLFVATLPFLRWRPAALFGLAGAMALVMPVVVVVLTPVVATSSSTLGWLLVSGTYPALVWSAFVLTGLGVGRLALGSRVVALRLLAVGAGLALLGYGTAWGVGALSALVWPATGSSSITSGSPSSSSSTPVAGEDVDLTGKDCYPWSDGTVFCEPAGGVGAGTDEALGADYWLLFTADPHSGSTLEVVGSGGVALAVLALCLLATRSGSRRAVLLLPLAAVGSMALTAYCGHVLAFAFLGDEAYGGSGLGLYAWFVAVTLVGCTLWVRLLGRGPLERAVSAVARRAATAPPTVDR